MPRISDLRSRFSALSTFTRFLRKVLGITRQKGSQSTGYHPTVVYYSREFKQITTAGATTATVPEKVWGVRRGGLQNFKFSKAKYKETWPKEFKISFI